MKKLLTFLFVIQFHFIYSQSFVQENKVWNVSECMNFAGCGTQSFLLSGDTTIGEYVYKKLYSTFDTIQPNWGLLGAMRENADKVYLHNFETETLLYDFDLAVNDIFSSTINFFGWNCEFELVVQQIDSVTLYNGERRERILFNSGEEWIKGIGSLNGPIYIAYYNCIFDMYYELSCCHENEELVYMSPGVDKCYVNTVGIEEIKLATFSIFPNPNNGTFQIQSRQQENLSFQKLSIYNLEGKVVFVSENPELLQSEIELPSLPNGMYFAQLAFRENTYSVKFLIQD
jgi:hypothetical protein